MLPFCQSRTSGTAFVISGIKRKINMAMQKGKIGVTTENIFPIIKKFLYSDHEIFLREIVSNGIDAINKLKALSGTGEFKGTTDDCRVSVSLDKEKKTITVSDNGIGMTAEEIDKYINQIAFSSAEEFLEKYKNQANAIIGHFGLGFYSAFMVSEKVEIITRSHKDGAKAMRWECDGSPEYKMEETEKEGRGTDIILGGNPVYNAPADVQFAAALEKQVRVQYAAGNETGRHLPVAEHHAVEGVLLRSGGADGRQFVEVGGLEVFGEPVPCGAKLLFAAQFVEPKNQVDVVVSCLCFHGDRVTDGAGWGRKRGYFAAAAFGGMVQRCRRAPSTTTVLSGFQSPMSWL